MADKAMAGSPGESRVRFIVAAALVALLGIGGGLGYGLLTPTERLGQGKSEHQAVGGGQAIDEIALDHTKSDKKAVRPSDHITPLEPIIVNLAGENRTWLRIEGSLGFGDPPGADKAALVADISEDLAVYLRGVSLAQLESRAGLEFLREDLTEIARLRSRDKVRRFILRSLVVE